MKMFGLLAGPRPAKPEHHCPRCGSTHTGAIETVDALNWGPGERQAFQAHTRTTCDVCGHVDRRPI